MSDSRSINTTFKVILEHPVFTVCASLILTSFVLASFAYFLLPDKTSDANRQILPMALKQPGTQQSYIVIPRPNISGEKPGFIHQLVFGIPDNTELIPYDYYTEKKGEIKATFKGIISSFDDVPYIQIATITHWAGTDTYGRDVFSRLILGLRVSLFVGFFSVLVSIILGLAIGSAAGYFGGKVDKMIMLIINTSWSIPTILMAFAIIVAFGKGFIVIVLAIGLTMWVDVARIVRGQVLQIREELYVKAGRTLGLPHSRVLIQHIFPNLYGTLSVMAAANFATAILVEAGLSFLGLGVQPPTPSLGNMLQEGYAYATGGFVYLAFFPILTIMILVLCFNLIGTSMRDIYDVKTVD